jgi:predicted Fe-Mo cluster-binding NifX family protein
VTYENGEVFQHFGHTERFKIYDVKDGRSSPRRSSAPPGQGHGALAGFLRQCQVDALICGGIGMGARNALQEAGIRLYSGVQGSADTAAQALAAGTLQYDPDAACDHHGHHGGAHDCGHHHGGAHDCGHHNGGAHDCGHHHGGQG